MEDGGQKSEVGGRRSECVRGQSEVGCESAVNYLGRRDALQEFEFVPPRVELRDLVACCFQLSLQLENLGARFRIKIWRGKCGLQVRYLGFRGEDIRLHRFPFTF